MQWLACRVITGKEYLVRAKIKKAVPDAKIEVPRRYFKEIEEGKLKEKSERILPGYLLIGTEKPIDTFLLKDFIKVVGTVTEEEIAGLRAQEGTKKESLGVGARILIIEGPFQGYKGNILEAKEGEYLKCRVVFNTIEIEIELREDFVSIIN